MTEQTDGVGREGHVVPINGGDDNERQACARHGDIGIGIAPVLDSACVDTKLGERLDALMRRTCEIARALIGAEQSALKLCVGENPAQARKYFSLSEQYGAYDGFRVDPKGLGLHGMTIPPGEVVRLTEEEVLEHPLFHGFAPFAKEHPPMRGWLATSVCGCDGRSYGLLQLSDKTDGGDFDERDEENVRELAALVGQALDWLRSGREASTSDSTGVFADASAR